MGRGRKKYSKNQLKKLDKTDWLIICIGIFLLGLGIYSVFTVFYKVYEIQHGSDIFKVEAVVTTAEKTKKGLTIEQSREKARLEEMGLQFNDYDYYYRTYVEFETKDGVTKAVINLDEPLKKGEKVEVSVFKVFGNYKVVTEDTYGISAFTSYLVCGIIGILFGIGVIFLPIIGLAIDNAPIKKQLKKKKKK